MDRANPLTFTKAPETKPEPLTVSVNPELPIAADEGDKELMLATPFILPTVNVTLLDVPPPGPGLVTLTLKLPVLLVSEAKTEASTWLEEI